MFSFPDRCKLVSHKGKNIFLMDFSGLDTETVLKIIPECKDFVSRQPLKSLLILTDISNARYSQDTTEALKDLAKSNKPYTIASSIVGVEGMKKIVYDSIVLFSGRKNMKRHSTREESVTWLSSFTG